MPSLQNPNNGDRPSRLALGRLHTGELAADERKTVQDAMTDGSRAYLDELEAIKAHTPALGIAGLRTAADLATDSTAVIPPPANNWKMYIPVLLLAAIFVLSILPTLLGPEPGLIGTDGGGSTALKGGGAALLVYQLHNDEALRAYEGNALGEGDALGFRVNSGSHTSLVLMSVDGRGAITVFYPREGDAAVQLEGTGETTPLPGTIVLDGAPGPEIFVAVFDSSVAEARTSLEQAYSSSGAGGVLTWAQMADNVDAVSVERH